MPGKDLDLKKPVVKLVTLKSAKGLEFPVVALAGFIGMPNAAEEKGSAEKAAETEESLSRERRSYFVGMTRAMRALLVVRPRETTNPLLEGFSPELWNVR